MKLEVLGDRPYPNMTETLAAAEALIGEGFKVMVYCSDDPIVKALEDMGCVAVMPLAAIGSGLGVRNPISIRDRRAGQGSVLVDAEVGSVRRRRRHGAWLRRGLDEYRHRRGRGSGQNGPGHETGRGIRAVGPSCRPHAKEDVRRSVESARGTDLGPNNGGKNFIRRRCVFRFFSARIRV